MFLLWHLVKQSLHRMRLDVEEGRIKTLEGRHASNTTATSLEEFAEELARAYGEA